MKIIKQAFTLCVIVCFTFTSNAQNISARKPLLFNNSAVNFEAKTTELDKAFTADIGSSVQLNFANNFTLTQIAEKLQTTEAKLNELSKLHTNKTAQNVIYSLTISEAKRLLIYQNLSVKEIAYQLGFNDPFYFSNFFKKHTNLSPKVFKQNFTL